MPPGSPPADPKLTTVSKLSTTSTPPSAPPAPTPPGAPPADPKLTTVSKLSTTSTTVTPEDLKNSTSLAALPPSTAKFNNMTADEKDTVIQNAKTALSKKNELQGELAAKYDSQAVFLSSQDVSYVEAGNNETAFVGHVGDFLKEIDRDKTNYEKITGNNKSLQDQLAAANADLETIRTQTDWTGDDLRKYTPSESAASDISFDTMSKSAGLLGDMTKDYVNKMDGTAAAYMQAWDQTKHNQYKQETFSAINTVLDLATGFGIGGNAITQFAAKEFSEVGKTFDRMTNAYWLRAGQVGDMTQAAMNAGYSFKNFGTNTTAGHTGEIQGNTDSTNSHLVALSKRFNDWITEYNKPGPDPNPFVIV